MSNEQADDGWTRDTVPTSIVNIDGERRRLDGSFGDGDTIEPDLPEGVTAWRLVQVVERDGAGLPTLMTVDYHQ